MLYTRSYKLTAGVSLKRKVTVANVALFRTVFSVIYWYVHKYIAVIIYYKSCVCTYMLILKQCETYFPRKVWALYTYTYNFIVRRVRQVGRKMNNTNNASKPEGSDRNNWQCSFDCSIMREILREDCNRWFPYSWSSIQKFSRQLEPSSHLRMRAFFLLHRRSDCSIFLVLRLKWV